MKNKIYSTLIFFIVASFFFCNKLQSAALQYATLSQQVGIASSPNPVGSGARATGMGGAFIATSDDATAASWNPAGLIQLEKPEASIVGAYFHRTEDFSSEADPRLNNKCRIDDINLNYVSATYPFRLFKTNLVVSVNYQRLYEFERDFDYSSYGVHFSQDGSLGALGLAFAIQITPRLSIGATINRWTDNLFWDNEWEENYSNTEIRYTDRYSEFRGFNANFGVLWDITEYLTMGAVIKTPFKAYLRHDYRYSDTTTPLQLTIKEDVTIRMPMSYGFGLAWRLSDELSFDLDIYRTEWSKYTLTDDEGNKLSPITGGFKRDSHVKDTTQVRFGGEYLFVGRETVVPIRGGVFYDPQPSEGSPEDFYGISVGSGIGYKKFIFDMAYQLRWGRDVDTGNLITTSTADITQHLLLTSVIVHF